MIGNLLVSDKGIKFEVLKSKQILLSLLSSPPAVRLPAHRVAKHLGNISLILVDDKKKNFVGYIIDFLISYFLQESLKISNF